MFTIRTQIPSRFSIAQNARPSFRRNPDGTVAPILVNPNRTKRQIRFDHAGEHWFVDVMENSMNAIVFEK